tara:strand:+ start:933 stop:1274 length:342 start_codon:yes stop_codon:yes gene_type:complete
MWQVIAANVVSNMLAGDKKGGGQQQQSGGSKDNVFDTFMKMGEAAASRKGEILGITKRGQNANQQIAKILEQELLDAYGTNTRQALTRIYGPDGPVQSAGIRLPPSLQETLRS